MSAHRARKRFGQNFLRDPDTIRRIVRALAPRTGQRVLEIGPGRGALTAALLDTPAELIALELDRDLVEPLRQRFADHPRFELRQGDALRLDLTTLTTDTLRVVGNLPYNISTPLLFHLLGQRERITDMHFMLQREVVERLAAVPGTKAWGRLGVMVQYHCAVEPLFEVPPGAFSPAPKVTSAVVRLTPYARPPLPARDETALAQVVRCAFQQRRKTLRNTMQSMLTGEAIAAAGIDPGRRPDTLALEELVTLADTYSAVQESTP